MGFCDLQKISGAFLRDWPQPARCTAPVQSKIVGLIIKNEIKNGCPLLVVVFHVIGPPPDSTQDSGSCCCCCG